MSKLIILGVMTRGNRLLMPSDEALLDGFPTDICPAIEELDLDGKCTIYAICPDPKCHFTYKPEFKDGSPIASYPTYC
ncbi:uncharacterized protein EV420DRAFT_1281682 [Desarmillaria tabescens]|uniref:Uncharacterized protein n=1 Tax=Armillaria tabescens TaxID=1929756 RepID=A0AA39J3J7_ARMTA|nr:uncharacterized protein EV420DRAFT_1281682 [Desarmillaria tabescens]KAK0435457.1 hypothetical protein EV420DRAFT_1281682 [Desarmillaria tabescens]